MAINVGYFNAVAADYDIRWIFQGVSRMRHWMPKVAGIVLFEKIRIDLHSSTFSLFGALGHAAVSSGCHNVA